MTSVEEGAGCQLPKKDQSSAVVCMPEIAFDSGPIAPRGGPSQREAQAAALPSDTNRGGLAPNTAAQSLLHTSLQGS